MRATEKRLYEIIEALGEILNGSIHILDQSNAIKCDEREGEFRVYHSLGYCFDVKKEYICEPDEISQFDGVESDGFCYSFYSEWEGFKNDLTLESAILLINRNSHLPSFD